LADEATQVEFRLDPDAGSAWIDHTAGAPEGLNGTRAPRAAAVTPGLRVEAHELVHAMRRRRRHPGVGGRELTILAAKRAPGAHCHRVAVLVRLERVPGAPVVRVRCGIAIDLDLHLRAVVAQVAFDRVVVHQVVDMPERELEIVGAAWDES